jgi:hypothetical protein
MLINHKEHKGHKREKSGLKIDRKERKGLNDALDAFPRDRHSGAGEGSGAAVRLTCAASGTPVIFAR